MAENDTERTEPASPKRKSDAREKGDVAQSRELATVLVLGGILLASLSMLGANLIARVVSQARSAWGGTEIRPGGMGDFHALILHHAAQTGAALLPLLAVILVAGTIASLSQFGFLFSTKALEFKWERLDLVKGLKRLVNVDKLIELAKAVLKIGLLVATLWWALGSSLGRVFTLHDAPVLATVALATDLVKKVVMVALVILVLIAVLDVVWVRYRHEKKLRMTKQEVRDELRQREGSPEVRQQMRRMQRDLTRQRMIAEVGEADVVITNPTHYAVALRYVQTEMGAPRVVAKGRNYVAQRIREVARASGIPIVENPPLARVLYRTVKVGREVPESLFQAVAEILAYVYRIDPRRASAWRSAR